MNNTVAAPQMNTEEVPYRIAADMAALKGWTAYREMMAALDKAAQLSKEVLELFKDAHDLETCITEDAQRREWNPPYRVVDVEGFYERMAQQNEYSARPIKMLKKELSGDIS